MRFFTANQWQALLREGNRAFAQRPIITASFVHGTRISYDTGIVRRNKPVEGGKTESVFPSPINTHIRIGV